MIEVTSLCGQICLGKQGENLARIVYFDEPSMWKEIYGEGKCELVHQRSGDKAPYPVVLGNEDNKVSWKITESDTAIVGEGKCELHYFVDGVIVKSKIWTTTVLPSLGGASAEAPEPQKAWVDQVLEAAAEVEADIDAKPGVKTADGGEIFNDYENNQAIGEYSNVKGKDNTGSGKYSDIGGRANEGGYCAHIGGRENKGGSYDLMGGYKNYSEGGANIMGGVGNFNDGETTIMGGRDNTNHGKNNVIGGAENLIKKGHHFIGMFGRGHISSALYQLFGGAWSKATENTLFAIGNGSSDENRSNAFEVLKDGRAVLGAEPVNDMEATSKKYVDNNSANPLIRKAEGELIHIDDLHPQVQSVDFDVNLDNETETVDNKFIYVCGKNLLNLLDANGDVQDIYRGWLVNPTKQKITMSISDKDTSVDISGIYLGICDNGSEPTGGVAWFIEKGEIKRTSHTIDRKYISIYKPSTMTFKEAIRRLLQRFYIQVEFGSVATSYENFKGSKYEISETSISAPAMSMMNVYTNVPGAQIECEYNQDTNAVIEKLTNAVISLGGNV